MFYSLYFLTTTQNQLETVKKMAKKETNRLEI